MTALALVDSPFYLAAFLVQVVFYLVALAALWKWGGIDRSFPGKVALYFSTVNAAILAAWFQYVPRRPAGTVDAVAALGTEAVRPINILHLRDTHEVGGPGKTILETSARSTRRASGCTSRYS